MSDMEPPSLTPERAAGRLIERGDVPELHGRSEPTPLQVPDWPTADFARYLDHCTHFFHQRLQWGIPLV